MSIDTGASGMQRNVVLGDSVSLAETYLGRMLGLTVPLTAWHRVPDETGRPLARGERVIDEELRSIGLVGDLHHVDVLPPGYDRAAWTLWGDRERQSGLDFFIVFTSKTDVGIVVSAAVALAVAQLGGGEYWDSLYIPQLIDRAREPQRIVDEFRIEGYTELGWAAGFWLGQFDR